MTVISLLLLVVSILTFIFKKDVLGFLYPQNVSYKFQSIDYLIASIIGFIYVLTNSKILHYILLVVLLILSMYYLKARRKYIK